MAISIIERPYDINWSRNPIRYKLKTDKDVTTPGFYIQVNILFSKLNANTFNQIVTLSLLPDSTGICSLDISNILNGMLDYDIPQVMPAITPCINQVGNFRVQYREVSQELPNLDWTQDMTMAVIKGGISYEQWRGPNFFSNYMLTAKPFLTWQKSGFLCDTKQPLFLHFIQMYVANGQMKCNYKIHYTDGTEDISKVILFGNDTPSPQYGIWSIPAGISQMGLDIINPDKMIQWYEMSVEDSTGILAMPYRFNLDYRPFYDSFYFNFFNSLGGIDSIRIRGEWEQTQARTFDQVETEDAEYYLNANQIRAKAYQENVQETISYKGNAGFIDNVDVLDAYRELMLSSKIMQLQQDRWMFLIITPDKTSFAFNKQALRSLAVEWQYTFSNRNYTPNNIVMGNIPVCPVPLNLRNTGHDGYIYHFTFDTSPQQQSFIVEWSGGTRPVSGWISGSVFFDWEVYSNINVNTFDIDFSNVNKAKIRVTANCGTSNSGYSNVLSIAAP